MKHLLRQNKSTADLIRDLGDEIFAPRAAASNELLERRGGNIIRELGQALNDKDPEIASNVRRIISARLKNYDMSVPLSAWTMINRHDRDPDFISDVMQFVNNNPDRARDEIAGLVDVLQGPNGKLMNCLEDTDTKLIKTLADYQDPMKVLDQLGMQSRIATDNAGNKQIEMTAMHAIYNSYFALNPIGGLKSLEELVIESASMNDAPKLATIGDPNSIPMEINAPMPLENLQGLKNLERLSLQSAEIDEGELTYLKSLPKLKALDLYATRIDGRGLAGLIDNHSLEALFLKDTDVNDQGLEIIGQLDQLRTLDISGCKDITAEGLQHLQNLPHLRSIFIGRSDNEPQGTDWSELSKITSLRELNFFGLNDQDLKLLPQFKSIEKLDLTFLYPQAEFEALENMPI